MPGQLDDGADGPTRYYARILVPLNTINKDRARAAARGKELGRTQVDRWG